MSKLTFLALNIRDASSFNWNFASKEDSLGSNLVILVPIDPFEIDILIFDLKINLTILSKYSCEVRDTSILSKQTICEILYLKQIQHLKNVDKISKSLPLIPLKKIKDVLPF